MRVGILKAVANPPTILWGPFLPVMINLAVQFPFMFMAIGIFGMNPLVFLTSIVVVHTLLVMYGAKEPHISQMLQAYGETHRVSKNLYKVKGNKFEP